MTVIKGYNHTPSGYQRCFILFFIVFFCVMSISGRKRLVALLLMHSPLGKVDSQLRWFTAMIFPSNLKRPFFGEISQSHVSLHWRVTVFVQGIILSHCLAMSMWIPLPNISFNSPVFRLEELVAQSFSIVF